MQLLKSLLHLRISYHLNELFRNNYTLKLFLNKYVLGLDLKFSSVLDDLMPLGNPFQRRGAMQEKARDSEVECKRQVNLLCIVTQCYSEL